MNFIFIFFLLWFIYHFLSMNLHKIQKKNIKITEEKAQSTFHNDLTTECMVCPLFWTPPLLLNLWSVLGSLNQSFICSLITLQLFRILFLISALLIFYCSLKPLLEPLPGHRAWKYNQVIALTDSIIDQLKLYLRLQRWSDGFCISQNHSLSPWFLHPLKSSWKIHTQQTSFPPFHFPILNQSITNTLPCKVTGTINAFMFKSPINKTS